MDINYTWLKALIPGLSAGPEEVAHRLAMLGAPVDDVEHPGAGLEGLVVARVERVRPHPEADRLSLCDVRVGDGAPIQVVCGAPDVEAGGWYPFAPVGTTLPGGRQIGRASIRGQDSQGMLCSERELGLGRDESGLMRLDGEFVPGEPLVGALGLDDTRLVVDVTPNRPDLLCHLGVARELAEDGVRGVTLPAIPGAPGLELPIRRAAPAGETDGVGIRIEDAVAAPRYTGTVIRGVRIGPSPPWLAERLRAAGQRPINNVVDATNYVMLEMGQPMHAFDLALLEGPEIVVRPAAAGETIVTLDGETRSLSADMLVIADAARPVAIAGVMGGENSEVSERTRDVLLESALFEPRSVRATAKRLGLSTEASYRFERGVDPDMAAAVRRAVELIIAVAGGAAGEVLDVFPGAGSAPIVPVRPSRVARVLGTGLDEARIVALLEVIGFDRVGEPGDTLSFRVPGWRRYDVEREIDLIEEIARRYGYDNFPTELGTLRPSAVPDDPRFALEDGLRDLLVARGFLEARGVPFAGEEEGDVALMLPLSQAESRLRRDLVTGLIRRAEYNFARGTRDVRLFEIGTIFGPAPSGAERPHEETRLALVLTGARAPVHWSAEPEPFDLWDAKGLLEELAGVLDAEVGVDPETDGIVSSLGEKHYDPPRLGLIRGGTVVGLCGRIGGARVDAPAWADAIFALEVRLTADMAKRGYMRVRPLPAHPAVDRDLALLVPQGVGADRVAAALGAAGGALLQSVAIFDVYEGEGVAEARRSIGYRLRFRAADRTLTDDEVDRAVADSLAHVKEELGVERRG